MFAVMRLRSFALLGLLFEAIILSASILPASMRSPYVASANAKLLQ